MNIVDPSIYAYLRALDEPINHAITLEARVAHRQPAPPPGLLLLVAFDCPLDDLRRDLTNPGEAEPLGAFDPGTPISHPDNFKIVTGHLRPRPGKNLSQLFDLFTKIPGLKAVESGLRLFPDLDKSIVEIRARAVHSGDPSLQGEGVVIGVIESGGFEWRHGTFVNPDNSSRFLAIWDQFLHPKASPSLDEPQEQPGPLGIGVVYPAAELTRALRDEEKLYLVRTNPDRNKDGHGTHVAGIAAGNGRPEPCCGGPGTYMGVAPKADILGVTLAAEDLGSSPMIVEALKWIFDMAGDKPCVVNISMGSDLGSHDGNSVVELAMDALVHNRPGRAIVKSAGNQADQRRHVEGTVPVAAPPATQTSVLKFEVPTEGSSGTLDLWLPQGSELDLEIIDGDDHRAMFPFNVDTPAAPPPRVASVIWRARAPFSNDVNARIELQPGGNGFEIGVWTMRLINRRAIAVPFHCWIDRGTHSPRFLAENDPRLDPGDIRPSTRATITLPGTARSVICVANYVFEGTKNDAGFIHKTSSRGPVRRDAGANEKPTLAAPGMGIDSANSEACNLQGDSCECCCDECSCLYKQMKGTPTEAGGGTSMSAPHVAGAVALMFQVDRTLTAADVSKILTDTVQKPAPTPPIEWGAGKLDVAAAIAKVRARQGVVPQPVAPATLSAATPVHDVEPPVFDGVIAHVRSLVSRLPDGDAMAYVISRHFTEVRRLVNSNTRVATMWHRAGGPQLLARVVRGALQADAPPPIVDDEQREYLGRLFEQLTQFGSDRLKANIARHQPRLMEMLATPLAAQAAGSPP